MKNNSQEALRICNVKRMLIEAVNSSNKKVIAIKHRISASIISAAYKHNAFDKDMVINDNLVKAILDTDRQNRKIRRKQRSEEHKFNANKLKEDYDSLVKQRDLLIASKYATVQAGKELTKKVVSLKECCKDASIFNIKSVDTIKKLRTLNDKIKKRNNELIHKNSLLNFNDKFNEEETKLIRSYFKINWFMRMFISNPLK